MTDSQRPGYLYVLLATLLWSANFVIAKDLSHSVPPVTLAFMRWLIALLALTPFAIRSFLDSRSLVRQHLWYLIQAAFFGVTVFNTLIYIAGRSTSAVNMSLISISSPIFMILFSVLFRNEIISIRKLMGTLVILTGVLLLLTKGNLQVLTNLTFTRGDLWMLLAAISFAIYSMFVQSRPPAISTTVFLFSTFLLGVIMLVPFFAWETLALQVDWVTGKSLGAVLYLGIFASLVSFMLWNKAVALIGVSNAGLVYYLLPVFSGLLAFIFLGENIGVFQVLSMGLIVSGLLITSRGKR
ncbi:MAG: DMT family transporter [Bacteroidetes bacterium]|nr:DMT family transporter [Bacteroidota bacterium]